MKVKTETIYELDPAETVWAFRGNGSVDLQRIDIDTGVGFVIRIKTRDQVLDLIKQLTDIVPYTCTFETTNHVECNAPAVAGEERWDRDAT